MKELSEEEITIFTWVLTAATIILTVGRYAIRFKTVKAFKADDYFHGAALLSLIALFATYTAQFHFEYVTERWHAGTGRRFSAVDRKRLIRLEIAVETLFWVVIFFVKVTFLFFYRFLFGVSSTFMRAWGVVFAFTTVTFMTNFLSVFWDCEAPRHLFVRDYCISQRAIDRRGHIILMWCVLNVASSLSIMILPLWMLHGLKISKTRKIGLAALFSIAMTDVALDIVRTIFTLSINRHPNASGDTIWNVLEAVIAVVLSSLPTYKSLPGLAKQKKHSSYEDLAQGKCNMTDPKQICRIDDFDILESRLSSAEW